MNSSGNEHRLHADQDNKDSRQSPTLVDKFVIRLPQGLRDQIKELSEHNHRSMNSEIIRVLEQHIQQNQVHELMDHAVAETKASPPTDDVLTQKLRTLPAEKKEALLSLLT